MTIGLDLFSIKACDQVTIPLASIIELQYKRAEAILKYWTGCLPQDLDAEEYFTLMGWFITKKGEFKIKLVDTSDELYAYPRSIVKGCGCKKKKCTNCLCSRERNGCTSKTCKCSCFMLMEDTTTSTQIVEESFSLEAGDPEVDDEDTGIINEEFIPIDEEEEEEDSEFEANCSSESDNDEE